MQHFIVFYAIMTTENKESINERNVWDVLSEFTGKIDGPKDWSEKHDHYLYGL